MDKIAVLIPCYNEEKTIEKVVRDAKAALPEAVIYVYNNNSTDRTAELAEKASIYGALTLYLDFINIFLYVVRLMGNGRRRD